MKKIIVGLIIIIAIIGLAYILKDITIIDVVAQNDRFIQVDNTQRTPDGYVMTFYYDKETGVEYEYSGRGGLTLLVDKEGKPLLYEEEE